MKTISSFNDHDRLNFCQMLSVYPTAHMKGIKKVVDDVVVCGVGLDNWTENSVQFHIIVLDPKEFTRRFIQTVFEYVFVTCNLGLAIGVTPCNNVKALDLNRRIGFREIARIPNGHAVGNDTALQVLRREDCIWLKREEVHGERITTARSRLHSSGERSGSTIH